MSSETPLLEALRKKLDSFGSPPGFRDGYQLSVDPAASTEERLWIPVGGFVLEWRLFITPKGLLWDTAGWGTRPALRLNPAGVRLMAATQEDAEKAIEGLDLEALLYELRAAEPIDTDGGGGDVE